LYRSEKARGGRRNSQKSAILSSDNVAATTMVPFGAVARLPELEMTISSAAAPPAATNRLTSVDALRGFSIFWLLGGDGAIGALEEMSRGKAPWISATGRFLGEQFEHVPWEGFRFYDFIFPLLIFVIGVSIALSLSRVIARDGYAGAHWRVFRRFVLLFVLGVVFYGGAAKLWPDVRLLGVLQRIALCYLLASLILMYSGRRGSLVAIIVLLVGYWAAMTFIPVPGVGAGSYAPETNLADWIDARYLPGRLFQGTRDPEGMLSTLPAVATCLIGVLAGLYLQDPEAREDRKSLRLVAAGVALLLAGYAWDLSFPIIKSIWTSSFVLVAGGYSLVLLGVLHWIVDVRGLRGWPAIFVWIGANALPLYFFDGIASFERLATRFVGGDIGLWIDRVTTPGAGRFAAHALGLVFAIVLARELYRRRIFIRV
jgi:predicted acyltransferase